MRAPQIIEMRMPCRQIGGETDALPVGEQGLQRGGQFADVRPVDALDLVYFRAVDVDVRDVFCVRREAPGNSGDPIVEARADGKIPKRFPFYLPTFYLML